MLPQSIVTRLSWGGLPAREAATRSAQPLTTSAGADACQLLDHGEGGQLKIAGNDQYRRVQQSQGKGQLPGRTTNPKRTAGVPVLPADAQWRSQDVIIAARVATEPGDVGSSGAACANRDRLYWTPLSPDQPGLSGGRPGAFCTPACSDAGGGRAVHQSRSTGCPVPALMRLIASDGQEAAASRTSSSDRSPPRPGRTAAARPGRTGRVRWLCTWPTRCTSSCRRRSSSGSRLTPENR